MKKKTVIKPFGPKKKREFKTGDVIVFDPSSLNKNYWDNLSEKDRKRYWGPFGYGAKTRRFFVFLTDINDAPGHCVIISMEHSDKNKVITMAHNCEFRKVREDEF